MAKTFDYRCPACSRRFMDTDVRGRAATNNAPLCPFCGGEAEDDRSEAGPAEGRKALIRRATAGDAAAIQAIYAEEQNEENTIGTDYGQVDWVTYVNVPQIILLVADVNRQIQGFVLGYDQFDWGYMDTLIVRREARGNNLGQRLFDAFARCGEGRWVAVEWMFQPDDKRVEHFYDRMGVIKKDPAVWCVKYLE